MQENLFRRREALHAPLYSRFVFLQGMGRVDWRSKFAFHRELLEILVHLIIFLGASVLLCPLGSPEADEVNVFENQRRSPYRDRLLGHSTVRDNVCVVSNVPVKIIHNFHIRTQLRINHGDG